MKESIKGTEEVAPKAESAKSSMWEGLKDKAKDFAESSWDKISSKTAEWKNTIVETVKMNTVDKWKMMAESWNNNRLVAQKEKDIAKQEGRIRKLEDKVKEHEMKKDAESWKFNDALSKIDNPKLREVFERSKTEKVGKFDEEIEAQRLKVGDSKQKGEKLQNELSTFKEGVEGTRTEFNGKIDNAIDKIKEKTNYEVNIEDRNRLNTGIDQCQELIGIHTSRIKEYEEALTYKDLLSKADRKEIKEELKKYKGELRVSEKKLETMNEAVGKLNKHIASADKKVASWEAFRGKYVSGNQENGSANDETSGEKNSPEAGNDYEYADKENAMIELGKGVKELEEALSSGATSEKIKDTIKAIDSTLREAEKYMEDDDAKAVTEGMKITEELLGGGKDNEIAIRKGAMALYRTIGRFYQETVS